MLDEGHEIFVSDEPKLELFASKTLERIGDFVDGVMLGPEVVIVVTSTSTERDEVVDLEVVSSLGIHVKAQALIVIHKDPLFLLNGNVSFTVRNFLTVAVVIGVRAKRAGSYLRIWASREVQGENMRG